MAVSCSSCKGRGFCGLDKCIYLDRIRIAEPVAKKVGTCFFGSSPPSVFVGRIGYPRIFAGALAPPLTGDTNNYDNPSLWAKNRMGIPDILSYRTSLVHSRFRANIKEKPAFLDSLQEIAMSCKSAEFEARYDKPIRADVGFFSTSAPIGPSGNISYMKVTQNAHVPKKTERLVSDTHAAAKDAVLELAKKSACENSITKLLSVGLLGRAPERKLVPTRWSITAVDDILGKDNINRIKEFNTIDSVQLLKSSYNGNRFWIILAPNQWSYELIEFTHEGAVWSDKGAQVSVTKDFEDYFGRKTYADITAGGYYAARLAVLEHLAKIKRQATSIVVREILPDYYAPLGVWVVRETVRDAMRSRPLFHESLDSAVSEVQKEVRAGKDIFSESVLLKTLRAQKRLFNFARKTP